LVCPLSRSRCACSARSLATSIAAYSRERDTPFCVRQAVERPRLDQRLDHLTVDLAPVDALAEVEQR
jgi:hypothetical protein